MLPGTSSANARFANAAISAPCPLTLWYGTGIPPPHPWQHAPSPLPSTPTHRDRTCLHLPELARVSFRNAVTVRDPKPVTLPCVIDSGLALIPVLWNRLEERPSCRTGQPSAQSLCYVKPYDSQGMHNTFSAQEHASLVRIQIRSDPAIKPFESATLSSTRRN
jgi:hypothetical protein